MDAPVKYAKNGDVNIAYRVFDGGARDIVIVAGTLSHVEVLWEIPVARRLLQRLTAFARVIVFDKRGQGLSDRVAAAEHTLEERIGDLRAVMDATGSARATLYGYSEGGPMSLMFCATYPERVTGIKSAKAWANNEVAYVAWVADGKIRGCLGFEVTRAVMVHRVTVNNRRAGGWLRHRLPTGDPAPGLALRTGDSLRCSPKETPWSPIRSTS